MTYKGLIDLGFERIEQNDSVLFDLTGYKGFILEKTYEKLNISITILCPANSPEWRMNFFENDTGDRISTPFDDQDFTGVVKTLDFITKRNL